MRWNPTATKFLKALSRYLDFEGGIRAGKSWALIWKLINYAQDYPGINMLLSRWTQDSLDAQLKPLFWSLCPKELLADKPWNAQEEYVLFANGSRLYLRALKTSDESSRYGKVAGLTLAIIAIDQAEELPEWMWAYLKGRLSQPKYPQQLIITPNPPPRDHWITRDFPADNSREGYEYISTTPLDNRQNLGEAYVADLLKAYPPGHPMRLTFIEGQRGSGMQGEAVYAKVFKPRFHVSDELQPLKGVPIMEAWDFGQRHPAVVWSQFTPWGAWHILGELQGDSQYLEDFAPLVLQRRKDFFGDGHEYYSCCDPSGADATSHGTRRTAIDILGDYGVYPTYLPASNRADRRDYAIQNVARLMLRLTSEGPAFQIHSRCAILIDGFTSGYVYSELVSRGNIRKPLKDGYYDHTQNGVEYTILNYLSPEMLTDTQTPQHSRALPYVQGGERDEDEMDFHPTTKRGLAGY